MIQRIFLLHLPTPKWIEINNRLKSEIKDIARNCDQPVIYLRDTKEMRGFLREKDLKGEI